MFHLELWFIQLISNPVTNELTTLHFCLDVVQTDNNITNTRKSAKTLINAERLQLQIADQSQRTSVKMQSVLGTNVAVRVQQLLMIH